MGPRNEACFESCGARANDVPCVAGDEHQFRWGDVKRRRDAGIGRQGRLEGLHPFNAELGVEQVRYPCMVELTALCLRPTVRQRYEPQAGISHPGGAGATSPCAGSLPMADFSAGAAPSGSVC